MSREDMLLGLKGEETTTCSFSETSWKLREQVVWQRSVPPPSSLDQESRHHHLHAVMSVSSSSLAESTCFS